MASPMKYPVVKVTVDLHARAMLSSRKVKQEKTLEDGHD